MAARRRIRVPVRKRRRPHVPDLAGETTPAVSTSPLWKVLREIDELIDGIDDMLDDQRVA